MGVKDFYCTYNHTDQFPKEPILNSQKRASHLKLTYHLTDLYERSKTFLLDS